VAPPSEGEGTLSGASGTAAAARCAIAVVTPVFRQTGLLAEAVASVLGQRDAPDFRLILVDDGCPYPETPLAARSLARAHPGRVVLLRQGNRGLAAARNTGIEHALASWPECRGIFFLDADNRLRPRALARAHAALEAAAPEIGWFYPDLDMFGIPGAWSTGGRYSLLLHLLTNYCEAGSLVRRAVFEAGIRFDETLRHGFEDWDFWLRAAAAGFRGQHVPSLGLRYRRRKESMVRDAERDRAGILEAIRQRHRDHFRPRRLLALEAAEAPRFAIMETPAALRFAADPLEAGERVPAEAACERALLARATPAGAHFPLLCAFADAAALRRLGAAGLLRGVFWHAAARLAGPGALLVRVEQGGEDAVAMRAPVPARLEDPSHLLLLRSDALFAGRSEAAPLLPAEAAVEAITVELPGEPPGLPVGAAAPAALARALRRGVNRLRDSLPPRWRPDWRPDGRIPVAEAPDRAAAALWQCGPLLPCTPAGRDIAFVLPACTMGGVERVTFAYARVLRARGWRCHLLVSGAEQALLPPDILALFDGVTFLAGFEAERREGGVAAHLGAATSSLAEGDLDKRLLGLLAPMSAMLTAHSFAGHALAGLARRAGVRTFLGLHVQERGRFGEPEGNPQIALGYEHAYDGFVVVSEQLRRWCIGQAVPPSKILMVPNGPGYESDAAAVAASAAAKRERAASGEALRVLYLGRLDAQKGIGRLRALIAATAGAMRWRVVGGAVLGDEAERLAGLGVTPERPVSDAAALDALYAWADVVVLTSHFEGYPLVVPEAQRMGCAVVASDVGAVAEAVGDAGVLVRPGPDDAATAAAFASALHALAADRAALLRLGEAGMRRVGLGAWERRMAPWVEMLERLCPA